MFRKNAVVGTTILIGRSQCTVMEVTSSSQTVAAKQKQMAVENWKLLKRATLAILYTQRYTQFGIHWFCLWSIYDLNSVSWSKIYLVVVCYLRTKDGYILPRQTNTIEDLLALYPRVPNKTRRWFSIMSSKRELNYYWINLSITIVLNCTKSEGFI